MSHELDDLEPAPKPWPWPRAEMTSAEWIERARAHYILRADLDAVAAHEAAVELHSITLHYCTPEEAVDDDIASWD